MLKETATISSLFIFVNSIEEFSVFFVGDKVVF